MFTRHFSLFQDPGSGSIFRFCPGSVKNEYGSKTLLKWPVGQWTLILIGHWKSDWINLLLLQIGINYEQAGYEAGFSFIKKSSSRYNGKCTYITDTQSINQSSCSVRIQKLLHTRGGKRKIFSTHRHPTTRLQN